MTTEPVCLNSKDIPQADVLERVLSLVKHVDGGGAPKTCIGFRHHRSVKYYVDGAGVLGLLDQEGKTTPAAHELHRLTDHERRRHLAMLFAQSVCGATWMTHQGVATLEALDPHTAEEFLARCTKLTPSTRKRRAVTLRSWHHALFGEHEVRNNPQTRAASLPKQQNPKQQCLAQIPAAPVATASVATAWPNPRRFPHNEGGQRVRKILDEDTDASRRVLLVVGYASLDQIITFLAKRAARATDQSIRLLFGHEPYPSRREHWQRPANLSEKMRDYWLDRGVSILLSGEILEAIRLLETGVVAIRIGSTSRTLHAKIFLTETAAIVGSSNFTQAGLFGQSEGNVRFENKEQQRFNETAQLAESFWTNGVDYRDELHRLLDALLKAVTWKEALARGCAAILEGAWVDQYTPTEDIAHLNPPLWPHQREGLLQALWILENVGSVLIADATGSGKTRMGAWVTRYARDRHARIHVRHPVALVLVPPPLVPKWNEDLAEAGLRIKVDSHGHLSSRNSIERKGLLAAIGSAELLIVDEAHNFVNPSKRTRHLLAHHADQTILFTATPINRSATDLIALVELLGADNFSDKTLSTVARLRRGRPSENSANDALMEIQKEIERFMVRRTRTELNRIADEQQDAYHASGDRRLRYPEHQACYYECDAPPEDIAIATEIQQLCVQLSGVARIGRVLALSLTEKLSHVTEEHYLKCKVRSAPGLAGHEVLDCMNSSRASLYEHIHGTLAAAQTYGIHHVERGKAPTGNMLHRLERIAGQLPRWKLSETARKHAPDWLLDREAHRQTCESEARLYRSIGALALRISDARETAKLRHLLKLLREKKRVLAFDSRIISLVFFEHHLRQHHAPVRLFTGQSGVAAKRKAEELLGLKSSTEQLIALCSDALSEGLNLQGAPCVMHLDTPTVIRKAEQRAGRADRMDSPHEKVEVWWPKDPPSFAPRTDHLRNRHELVSDLIGANLELPGRERLDVIERARVVNQDAKKETPDASDAFDPVKGLIGSKGLITRDIYQRIRTSKVDVHTWIARAPAEEPWAFCVVAGLDQAAPRWVFLKAPGADPITDLGEVAAELRVRLSCNPPELQGIDARTSELIRVFVKRLGQTERALLPVRRKRALNLAERVLDKYLQDASDHSDLKRQAIVQQVLDALRADGSDLRVDLRTLADRWLQLIQPWWQEALRLRHRNQKIWTLHDLEGPLVAQPIGTDRLRRLLDAIPELPPIGERIVAMIVGVPSEVVGPQRG